jgi:hypothetical protein
MSPATEEAVMTRQSHQDPTELFSVVGATYIPERHADEYHAHDHPIDDRRSPRFELVTSAFCAAFCIVALAIALFADSGAAKLTEIIYAAY